MRRSKNHLRWGRERLRTQHWSSLSPLFKFCSDPLFSLSLSLCVYVSSLSSFFRVIFHFVIGFKMWRGIKEFSLLVKQIIWFFMQKFISRLKPHEKMPSFNSNSRAAEQYREMTTTRRSSLARLTSHESVSPRNTNTGGLSPRPATTIIITTLRVPLLVHF
jgi:hypothetical protein